MVGDGWNCSANVCTRSDALLATLSYPTITVIVNVASTAASSVTNTARVTGGGSSSSVSNDVTIVNGPASSNSAAVLSAKSTHSGNFTKGQQAATYTLTVSNASGAAATSGAVSAIEDLPASLTLVSMVGTGWTCFNDTCTRSDALSAGQSYPAITVTVNVASNAPSSVTNKVIVTGGGSGASVSSDVTIVN
jgi:uncharacterized repeat protein (TIGR01451 family)